MRSGYVLLDQTAKIIRKDRPHFKVFQLCRILENETLGSVIFSVKEQLVSQ